MFSKTTQSPEFIKKFRHLFESEKKRLLFTGRIVNEEFNVQPEEMMDEVDFTSFEMENQMRMRLRNRESLYLKKIEEALDRIDQGEFGLCESCGEEIEAKRLEARPTTTMCVSCKEASEKSEKLHIDGHRHKSVGSAKMRLA